MVTNSGLHKWQPLNVDCSGGGGYGRLIRCKKDARYIHPLAQTWKHAANNSLVMTPALGYAPFVMSNHHMQFSIVSPFEVHDTPTL